MSTETGIREIALRARDASHHLAATSGAQRSDAMRRLAAGLRSAQNRILEANAADLEAGRTRGLEPSFLDRLALTPERIEAMACAVEDIAAQPDPVGETLGEEIRPNGLRVSRQRIPLGVVAMIYEARPNVTSDAAALCLRSGNAVLLKGGSDARHSNAAIGAIVEEATRAAGLPEGCVQIIQPGAREELVELLRLDDLIDVVIPRGGEGLIRFVAEHARIPVIKHYKGVCHVYLDAAADAERARAIVVNAKASRPSVCNAAETLLVHADAAERLLPMIAASLRDAGVTLHGCPRAQTLLGDAVQPADDTHWGREFLSLDIALRIVDSIEDAVAHIARHGSAHTEAIVSDSVAAVEYFTRNVHSSCVVVNASTRFADGGELGLGAEIGISTSRLHAYGPMGAKELTTTRFLVRGEGQVR